MMLNSFGYLMIIFDENINSYMFDFGKINKCYIIEYKNVNGWIDVLIFFIIGIVKEL